MHMYALARLSSWPVARGRPGWSSTHEILLRQCLNRDRAPSADLAALQVLVVEAGQLRLPVRVQRREAARRHQVEPLHRTKTPILSFPDLYI